MNTTFRTVVPFVAKDNYKRCATNNDIYRCCHGGFPQFCELSAPVSINTRLKRYCNMKGNEFCVYIFQSFVEHDLWILFSNFSDFYFHIL